MHVLVTGAAGFIGYHLCKLLLDNNISVVGLDNLNDYYSVQLKLDRLNILRAYSSFKFTKIDLLDNPSLLDLFRAEQFTHVVNLAAQAGVRYSLENPAAYVQANINGFFHVLDACRLFKIQHFVYASSSSVYGLNTKMPFSVHDNVDHPISMYAATKKSNELMAHSYSHLFRLPCTGLRFFTVYGPWGRPDMALFLFTKAILEDQPITVFNHSCMQRDFTYIDDIVSGVFRILMKPATPNPRWNSNTPDPGTSPAPYRLYNIGNNNSVELTYFIEVIEKFLGKKATKVLLPLQSGDVPATYANIDDLYADFDFRPSTPIEVGIKNFVEWYFDYFGKKS